MSPTTLDQVIGDVRAAIKAIGSRGQVSVLVVKCDGCLLHEVTRDQLTDDDYDRLMRERPRRMREVRR